MLLIDFRSGSVEMLHGLERWHGELPMSRADCSQVNTAKGVTMLAPGPLPNSAFAPLLDPEV